MDLKSGCLYWPQINTQPPPHFSHSELVNDIVCDVAVVGGGITGALAAYFLTNAGLHVALLDRRAPAQGSTSANTGLLLYELDLPLVELAGIIGSQDAARAYRLCARALLDFEELVADLGDPCGLVRRPSLFLAVRPPEIDFFRRECSARRACGIDVEFLGPGQIAERFSIQRPAALLSPLAMEIDPYRLTRTLLASACARGLEIHSPCHIAAQRILHHGIELRCRNGSCVRARHVVFATGYETPEFLPIDVSLSSTFALATRQFQPENFWPERCLIWESASPYLYVRSTPDNRAIIGGEDVPFTTPERRDACIHAKTAILLDKFHTLFPSIHAEPACSWAGTFAETRDALPFIGPSPAFPRGFFALAYGGNGITFSLIAARIIRDFILHQPNPDAHLFRLDR